MKKLKKLLIIGCLSLIVGASATQTFASFEHEFAGSIKYNVRLLSMPAVKNNDSYNSGINWTTSSRGNHRLIVQIRDKNGYILGGKTIENKNQGDVLFRTTCSQNVSYQLYGARENIIDPETYVKGTWRP